MRQLTNLSNQTKAEIKKLENGNYVGVISDGSQTAENASSAAIARELFEKGFSDQTAAEGSLPLETVFEQYDKRAMYVLNGDETTSLIQDNYYTLDDCMDFFDCGLLFYFDEN